MSGRSPSQAVVVILLGVTLFGCKPAGENGTANTTDATTEPRAAKRPALPMPDPPLGREQLLALASRAASAYAAGMGQAPADTELAGRQFEMKIPFGCYGPSAEDDGAALGWSYESGTAALRLRAKPDVSAESPIVQAIGGEEVEAIEGFWIPRPWTASETCPPPRAGEPTAVPSPPSIGLARFFTESDSRIGRRDLRSYETVKRISAESLPREGGFIMALSGRLVALPSGQTVKCHSQHPNARPACLISVEIERVDFQNAETGETIATWHSG